MKQGDPLSPILFNLVIDELLDDLPEELGVTIEEFKCNSLAFADDLIVCADSKAGCRELLRLLVEFFDARRDT